MEQDFSVLIPARGSCSFLTQTLESICVSSIDPKEVILVDDGINPLAIKDIEEFYQKLNLTLLPSKGHGIVEALNTGLQYCSTPFVARLDADDLVTPNRFALQISTMASNSAIAVLGGQLSYIDSNGRVTGQSKYESGRLDDRVEFTKRSMLAHPAAMIRTLAATKVSGYRTICSDGRTDFAEDFDLWLRISRVGQIHNLNEVILLYRQHEAQISIIHAQNQTFATSYVAMVNAAQLHDPRYKFKVLVLEKYSLDFLLNLNKSIPKFASLSSKIIVVLEGLQIYLGITSNLLIRVTKKIVSWIS